MGFASREIFSEPRATGGEERTQRGCSLPTGVSAVRGCSQVAVRRCRLHRRLSAFGTLRTLSLGRTRPGRTAVRLWFRSTSRVYQLCKCMLMREQEREGNSRPTQPCSPLPPSSAALVPWSHAHNAHMCATVRMPWSASRTRSRLPARQLAASPALNSTSPATSRGGSRHSTACRAAGSSSGRRVARGLAQRGASAPKISAVGT
jgi:hypothetical protein